MARKRPWLIVQVEEDESSAKGRAPTVMARKGAPLSQLEGYLLQSGYVPAKLDPGTKQRFKVKAWIAEECCTPPKKSPQFELQARLMHLNESLERLESFAKSAWTHRPNLKNKKPSAVTGALAKAKAGRARQKK